MSEGFDQVRPYSKFSSKSFELTIFDSSPDGASHNAGTAMTGRRPWRATQIAVRSVYRGGNGVVEAAVNKV